MRRYAKCGEEKTHPDSIREAGLSMLSEMSRCKFMVSGDPELSKHRSVMVALLADSALSLCRFSPWKPPACQIVERQ